jgi:Stigma-specific protein, Stig1
MFKVISLAALLAFVCSCQCQGANGPDGGSGGGSAAGGSGGTGGGGVAGGGAGGNMGTGPTGCGQYESKCNGQCVVTVNDPANCGACGRSCQASEVCTGGTCTVAAACPVGLTACNGRCVDLQSSNQYCGACSAAAACPAGKGCSSGACVNTVPVIGNGPNNCPGGGPPVTVGSQPSNQQCAGTVAQVSFRWGLCSCGAVSALGTINTDGFASNQGPLLDGGLGGSVGMNSLLNITSPKIGGVLWVKGSSLIGGLTKDGVVRQDLNVGGTIQGNGTKVSGDARLGGSSASNLMVSGKVFTPTEANLTNVTAAGGEVRGPVNVAAPCDCEPSQLIDIKGIVADGKARNDNTLIGLSVDALNQGTTPLRLDLPCGRYFLTQIASTAAITVAVHGRTALFIETSINAEVAFVVDPNAELDVFIGGSVLAVKPIRFGSPETPAQSRFYINGSFGTAADGTIAGNFYMPTGTFGTVGNYTVYGSVFAGGFSTAGKTDIHYDRAILNAGSVCGADAGVTGCGSCRDCGNQACVNGTCGRCTDSSQCCAPLQCVEGQCVDGIN